MSLNLVPGTSSEKSVMTTQALERTDVCGAVLFSSEFKVGIQTSYVLSLIAFCLSSD